MPNWKEYKLGEIAEIIMGQSPAGQTCNETDHGTPLLNGPTEFGSSFPQAVQFTTDPKKFAKPLDILFCVRGSTTGRMNWADRDYAIGRGLAAIRHREGEKYRHFIKGLLDANLNLLLQSATGSTFPNVSKDQLNNISILAPDLNGQESIAEILSSLDDKIELNNQINKELEALAQALFKQWFIDFEFPNENGQPYKSSGGEMVDSELGKIPKGWDIKSLGVIAKLTKENVKPFESPKNEYYHYSLPEYDTGKTPSIEIGEKILSSKYRVFPYSILVSKLNPRIPRIWSIIDCVYDSICSTEFQVITPKTIDYFGFVNSICLSQPYIQSLQSKVTGTSSSHQRVNPKDIINYSLALPPEEIIKSYNLIVIPFLKLIEENRKENQELTSLRDALLPKLISGELEVSEAQVSELGLVGFKDDKMLSSDLPKIYKV